MLVEALDPIDGCFMSVRAEEIKKKFTSMSTLVSTLAAMNRLGGPPFDGGPSLNVAREKKKASRGPNGSSLAKEGDLINGLSP